MVKIFYNDDLNIDIIDVFHIRRPQSKAYVDKRPFHILTKRISGYTDMIFEAESFRVTADKLLYIPANSSYIRESSDTEDLIAIHFNILNVVNFTPVMIDTDSEKTSRVFMDIYDIWKKKKRGYKYRCTSLLYDFLSDALLEKDRSKEYYKLEKSIRFIKRNLNKTIYTDDLAKMSNLCETQYRKLFKKEFGLSPSKYINKLRINSAVSKLSSGYYSMAQIAEACGFSDQKYFNKIFKDLTGKSPSEYKKDYSYYDETMQ